MKKIILGVLGGLCLIVYSLLLMDVKFAPAKASPSNALNFDAVSGESQVTVSEGATSIALFAPEGALYETQSEGASGANEFLSQDPTAGNVSLLPPDFQSQARTARFIQNEQESHYFYQQYIDGIPVYGSQLAVHQRDNEIYSLSGNISNNSYVFRGPLDEEGAKKIAISEAGKETSASLQATSSEQVIFNGKALGVSDDPSNYLSWAVTVQSAIPQMLYGKKFIINSTSGEVLFTEEVVHEALNRQVYNCNNSTNCSLARSEGQGAVSVADVDAIYDIFGKYYSYLSDTFSRDSFDNQGGAMTGYADYRDQTCPNAWMSRGKIYACKGLVATDVISHEMTHAMNQAGPKFVYANQSGALDEALADIFASAIDNNYTMGEDTSLGIIRSMENPGQYGQPDRLFSPNYWCSFAQDQGGVHKNGGVIGKAFYLMLKGGSFNTCTINAVGAEKTYAIFYKASTNYMRSSTNFKDAYNAIVQACGDLYGGVTSETCIQVRNSMRATEMDQQTDGSQKSPKCDGQQPQKPDCSAEPGTTATPTPQGNGPTPTRTPTGSPTATAGPSQKITLKIILRLQGVFSKPTSAKAVPVAVKLMGTRVTQPLTQEVVFDWQGNGTLVGKADFAAPAGGGYYISVKPPLHLSRKICDTGPIEIFEGKYTCSGQTLVLKSGENSIDASGILQIAGDLPDEKGLQDNIINAYDIGLVQNNIGKTDAAILKRADLNYDGSINSEDLNIINLSSTIQLN